VKLWPRVGCLVFLTHGVDNASVVHLSASNAVLCCRVLRRNGLGIMFTDCSSVCAFVRASPERRRSPTGLPSKYSSSFSHYISFLVPCARLNWPIFGFRARVNVLSYRERKCADTIGTVLAPWAGHFQCESMNIFFTSKICGSNFIKQRSETVMV